MKMCRFLFPMAVVVLTVFRVQAKTDLSQTVIEKLYYQSYAFEKKGDYTGAIAALGPVLASYPSAYTVNYRTGWLLYCKGNYADARIYLRKAQQVCPSSVEILICIVLIAAAEKDWVRVEMESLQAVKIDYYNVSANYWYARSLMESKKYDQSEGVSRKMLTLFPTSVMFLGTLAQSLAAQGKAEANEVYLSIKVLDPGNELVKNLKTLPVKPEQSNRRKQ